VNKPGEDSAEQMALRHFFRNHTGLTMARTAQYPTVRM
jgi:hypothetical protein